MMDETRYREELEARITQSTHEEAGDSDVSAVNFRESAFTDVVLEMLVDLGQVPDIEACYFHRNLGRYVVKVNGWACDRESGEVDLVTTLYAGSTGASSFPPSEVRTAIVRAARVVAEAHRGVHREMEPASPAWDMMKELHDAASEVTRVRVIVISDLGLKDSPKLDADFEFEVQPDIWDLTRLHRAEASGLPYEPVEIDLVQRLGAPLACIPAPDISSEYEAFLALIPGQLLHDLYHEFGPRLLELNVRSFLQARGQVNRGIRDTLKNEPDRFLAYNNGIAITAESVDVTEGAPPAIRGITGLQVVNGGQTVASIHRAKNRDGLNIDSVYVQAKITVVKGGRETIEELVPLVSRYANTQNRVNEADFSANHPFHVKIQQLAASTWAPGEQHRWFYERARGQYEVARARQGTTPAQVRKFDETLPKNQKFDKVLLAKCVNAWEQLPHMVSRGGQKNFVEFMKRLARNYGPSWEPDIDFYRLLVAKVILYKQAERSAWKHSFSGYRANAVAYTLAAISYRTAGRIDLRSIWDSQACSPALARTIHEWMPTIHQQLVQAAGDQNVTEWCKKDECWRHIQTHGIPVPADLEGELSHGQPLPSVGDSAQQRGVGLTNEDRENIARTMQRTADDWIHLCRWGAQTDLLKPWQIGIAGTLATYAAKGWIDVPSARQANQAARMLEIADGESAWLPDDD